MDGAGGELEAEFTVEPFVDGDPGPHVLAALDAAGGAGVTVEFGPFGTRLRGPVDAVVGALDAVLRRSFAAGATRVSVQVEAAGGDVHGAVTERR